VDVASFRRLGDTLSENHLRVVVSFFLLINAVLDFFLSLWLHPPFLPAPPEVLKVNESFSPGFVLGSCVIYW